MRIAGSLLSLAGHRQQDQRQLFSQRLQSGANTAAKSTAAKLAAAQAAKAAAATAPATATTSSPATDPSATSSSTSAGDSATISAQGKAASDDQQDQVRSILARMFGVTQISSMDLKIDTGHQHGATSSSSQTLNGDASGLNYDSQQSYSEFDQSTLEAHGTISLADGRQFHLDLAYQRTLVYSQNQSFSLSGGTADNSGSTGSTSDAASSTSPFDLLLNNFTNKSASSASPFDFLLNNSASKSATTQASWPSLLWPAFGQNSDSTGAASATSSGSTNAWPSLLASLRVNCVATNASYRYSSNDGQHQVLAAGRAITLYLQASASLSPSSSQVDQVA